MGELNLGAGLGVAVREFPTASGPADYVLFANRKVAGVIEAKPERTTLWNVFSHARGIPNRTVTGHPVNTLAFSAGQWTNTSSPTSKVVSYRSPKFCTRATSEVSPLSWIR